MALLLGQVVHNSLHYQDVILISNRFPLLFDANSVRMNNRTQPK